MSEFDRAKPDNDSLWIRHFSETELSTGFGCCICDLGQSADAVRYADSSRSATTQGGAFEQSDFFVSLVLADAHLAAGKPEQASGQGKA